MNIVETHRLLGFKVFASRATNVFEKVVWMNLFHARMVVRQMGLVDGFFVSVLEAVNAIRHKIAVVNVIKELIFFKHLLAFPVSRLEMKSLLLA